MRKLFYLISFVLIVATLGCKNSLSEEALWYNNQIVSIQDELTEAMDTFLQSVNFPDANTAVLYKSAQQTSNSVVEKLKSIKQFEGGTSLFLESQNYITACQEALLNEGSQIVHIKAKMSVNHSTAEVAVLNDCVDSLYSKVNKASHKFDVAQKEFSRKYNFELENEELP